MDVLRELLRPWLDTLRTTRAAAEESETLWLAIPGDGRSWTTLQEPLELLVWLVRLSPNEFCKVQCELWTKPSDVFANDEGVTQPTRCTQVGLRASPMNLEDLRLFMSWFAGASSNPSTRPVTTAFMEARDTLQRQLQPQCSTPVDNPEAVICLDFESLRHVDGPAMLRVIVDAVKDTPTCLSVVNGVKLRLTEMKLSLWTVDAAFLPHVAFLVCHGVKVDRVFELCRREWDRNAAQDAFLALTTLFAGLVELSLPLKWVEDAYLPRVLSAVAYNRSLRRLSIEISGWHGRQVKPAAWASFALHSSTVCHRIDSVELTFQSECAVQQLLQVLRASDPLVLLFEHHATIILQYQHLRAAASRVVLFNPAATNSPEDAAFVDTHSYSELRILNHENEWWSVLLPGWGEAWVHDSDIVMAPVPSSGMSRGIRRVEFISKKWVSIDDMVAVLECVGRHVESLCILGDAGRDARPPAWSGLLSALPRLRELELVHVSWYNLEELVDAFTAYGRVLDRFALTIDCQGYNLSAPFEQALVDATHPMAQSLEKLGVCVPSLGRHWSVSIPDFNDQLVRILLANTRLVALDLEVVVADDREREQRFHQLNDALKPHNGVLLPTTCALSMCEKLAFLSAVWADKTSNLHCQSSVERFDCEVVANIFQFAAPRVHRQIRVVCLPVP